MNTAARTVRVTLSSALQRYAVFTVLLVAIIAFALLEPAFARSANLVGVLQAVSVVTILGVGVTITLAAGGFDLSVGATAAASVMAASYAMIVWGWGGAAALALCVGLGLTVGAFNALLIVGLRIPDMLATLGTLFLLGGLQLVPSAGRSISAGMMLDDGGSASGTFDPVFLMLGRFRWGGWLPLPVLIAAAVALLAWWLLERTRWGRVLYAVGGNALAAHLAGAAVARYRVVAYLASSTLAALGGALVAARVGRGDVSTGAALLLDAVGASLIGFAVLNRRRPQVLGTVVGALFVGVLLNGLTMLNAPYYLQDVVKGVVLVAALALTYGFSREARQS